MTALPGGFLRRSGAIQHRTSFLPARHLCVIDRIPATTVARTLLDMTATEHHRRVERATDDALAMGIVTGRELGRVLDEVSTPGRRKLEVFRAIVEPRRDDYVPVESELEARLAELLDAAGLPAPRRQVDLCDTEGWIGRFDFVYPEAWLILEADGRRHRLSVRDREADVLKDERLGALGWTVHRLTWHDVTRRGPQVVATVRRLLGLAGAA